MYGTFSKDINIKPKNKIKKFKVLKSFEINGWCVYEGEQLLLNEKNILVSHVGYLANMNQYSIEVLFNNNCIEEIIESNKTQNLKEENTNIEEDIYSKKYNIYEILTLIPNLPKDSKFKCSLNDEIYWYSTSDFSTLTRNHTTDYNDTIFIEDIYSLRDILEANYTIVKPVEEVKEKWARIDTHKDLCSAIVNKKMIRFDGEIVNPSKEYHDKQIEGLFKAFARGMFKIDYLEEN